MDDNKNYGKIFWNQIRESFTLERAIVRLVMAWLLTAILFMIKSNESFLTPSYAANVNIPMYACFVALFFVFFCALAYFKLFGWVETYGPMMLITIYGFLTMREDVELSYILVLAIMLAVSILYSVHKTRTFFMIKSKTVVIAIYIVGAIGFIAYFGLLSVFRYMTYRTPGYDFGIWVQMFHYLKTSFSPMTTCERSQLMSHFAVHFSPIYYLYIPFTIIFPSQNTLNILQVLTLVSGLIPVYKLCRLKGLSLSSIALFGLVFVLFPAIGCGTFYDLHENCFLLPFLLWIFYYVEKDDTKFIIIFAVLICLVKEDAPIYVACVGLYMMLAKHKYVKGLLVMVGAIGYFLAVTMCLQTFGAGIMESRFNNYSVEEAGSLWDLIRNIFTNPAFFASQCFSAERLQFLMMLFLPSGFMPLASKHISRLVLLIPMFLENLASDWQYQHSIFYQYAFGTCAILLYLAILNYSELGEKSRRFLGSLAICSSIVLLPVCSLSKAYYFKYYFTNPQYYQELDAMVESIPKDAEVTCSAFFLPHFADRDVAYEYEYTEQLETEYLVLDLRWNKVSERMILEAEKSGYHILTRAPGMYVILQKNNS